MKLILASTLDFFNKSITTMAENYHQKYSYHEMSNKVEQADRSLLRSRAGESTGEVESLRGRQDVGRMGDRVLAQKTSRPKDIQETVQRKKQKRDPDVLRTKESVVAGSGGQTILDFDNLTGYQPSTQQARAAYETLLVRRVMLNEWKEVCPFLTFLTMCVLSCPSQTTISSKELLGNQATSVLRDAAEEIIEILKDGNLKDPERHDMISKLLTGKPAGKRSGAGSGISAEQYSNFVQLGKQLDDYDEIKKKGVAEDGQSGDSKEKVDNDMGVAVLFDESDEDQEGEEGASDIEDGVVVDASSESEVENPEEEDAAVESENEEDQKLVQGDGSKKKLHMQERVLSVHEIDAHFLQRQLARHFDDADVSAKLANEVLEVLDIRNQSDVRECENKLLLLLTIDLFETINLLKNNRVRVWACVSMKRAQTDEERNEIEQVLMNEPTGEGKRVWDEIHSRSRAEDWSRERMRGLTDTLKSDRDSKDVSKALDSIKVMGDNTDEGGKMDVDEEDAVQDEEAKELDLEQLAFRDGAHTMTNKKCDLPDTSWRAMKKGYEEVHVPAVRSVIPKGEKLIEISELPPWTHNAFKGQFFVSTCILHSVCKSLA